MSDATKATLATMGIVVLFVLLLGAMILWQTVAAILLIIVGVGFTMFLLTLIIIAIYTGIYAHLKEKHS